MKFFTRIRFEIISLFLCLLLTAWVPAAPFDAHSGTDQPSSTSLAIDPGTARIEVGETVIVDVIVSDVTDLYGISIQVSFDPNTLEVIDADAGTEGVQIQEGSCPAADFVVFNKVDNITGIINYDVSALSPSEPCNGNGIVASINFRGLAEGSSEVRFDHWTLSTTDGIAISTSAQDGIINVGELPFKIYIPIVQYQ